MTRKEEIRQYLKERNIPITSLEANSIIEGIEWADEHPTPCSVRMVGSQSYSKQQLREMGFAFDLNGNVLSPNHLAKKAANYVIDKACEWLKEKNKMCMYELEMILGGNFIEDFRKAMKGE